MRLRLSLLIALVASFILPVAAQGNLTNQQRAAAINEEAIASIRRQYTAINKRLVRYRKVKKELSGFSLEGGDLVAYFDGPAVVKMIANHYGEGGRAFEEYYFDKNKLVFVFRKDETYSRPLSGKVIRTEQSRFYLENDRLIRWLDDKGAQVSLGTDEARQKQADYLEISSKFLAGARSRGATIESE